MAISVPPKTYYLPADDVHYQWDAGNEPTLTVEPGDTVVVWTRDISDNQVTPDSDAGVLADFDWDRPTR